jgi:hypothetical protein
LTKQLSKGKGEYLPPKDTASAVTFGDGARVLVMGENLSTLYQRYPRGFKKWLYITLVIDKKKY